MNMLLFWILLCGIGIATLQDLTRREVDNWLNFLMLVSGISVVSYSILFSQQWTHFLFLGGILMIGFLSMHLFYNARVFAGGDAKLLFALSPFFVSTTFAITVFGFALFVILLFLAGGFYGLFYSFVLYVKTFHDSNGRIAHYLKVYKVWWFVGASVILFLISFVYEIVFIFAVLTLMFPFLFSFAKGLEEVVMIKEIDVQQLRLGDWLAQDVKVGNQIVKSSFDGVTSEQLALLQKRKKKVLIRDGIPFVPAFLIAFLLYYLSIDFVLQYFFLIF